MCRISPFVNKIVLNAYLFCVCVFVCLFCVFVLCVCCVWLSVLFVFRLFFFVSASFSFSVWEAERRRLVRVLGRQAEQSREEENRRWHTMICWNRQF